jgi:hypothetical protein
MIPIGTFIIQASYSLQMTIIGGSPQRESFQTCPAVLDWHLDLPGAVQSPNDHVRRPYREEPFRPCSDVPDSLPMLTPAGSQGKGGPPPPGPGVPGWHPPMIKDSTTSPELPLSDAGRRRSPLSDARRTVDIVTAHCSKDPLGMY